MAMIFWTNEAISQYRQRALDLPVQQVLSDLVSLVEERPLSGWTVADLLAGPRPDPEAERVAVRVRASLTALPLPASARVVVGVVPRPKGALPPPVLAVLVHIEGAPGDSGCDHTILTMGIIARAKGSTLG